MAAANTRHGPSRRPAPGSVSRSQWGGQGRPWTTPRSSPGTPTLTFELLDLEHFATRAQARHRVAAWIDEYNRDRRHSALGMVSPIAFELAQDVPAAASLPAPSPASRPSPAGGLRPALTPAPDDSAPRPRERRRRNASRARSS